MPQTTEAAALCANPECTREKKHPGLCSDDIAARTGLTVKQVQTVLDFEARMAVENPQNIQAGDQVKLTISECPDLVTGTVVRVYLDAIGSLVADIQIGDDVRPQNVKFLTRVDPSYAQTVTRLAREYHVAKATGQMSDRMIATMLAKLRTAAGCAGVSAEDAYNDLWDEVDTA
ncbi:hypothetical protein Caci_2944 [Catenulispora acidiphila DSM 44928]|uniref:Uncharacterized protein n=1 Tax=Catenulispora acidiphila (strain DSM 44928 / JCM 14897 / NBRC 102108 / NRRL B-24433 / ID139908) TaxID=479433 RepID=C7Q2W1_CATAD|nr:hypothetical protein [Catenulispora acidiphila]ACU71853.1 hypothetical protein Caci_2944 [Catenulispora acidiphila DSM 44928]